LEQKLNQASLKQLVMTKMIATECVADLDYQSEMIIFGSILTTFQSRIIFGGRWGSIENWLEPKTEPPLGNLACPNP